MINQDNGVPGVPKEEFLQSVRESLGRENVPPAQPYPLLVETLADLERQAAEIRQRILEDRPTLLDKLADMAGKGGWKVYRAAGVEEAVGYIESVVLESGASNIVRSAQEVFDQVPVDAALANLGLKVTTVLYDEANSREALREEIRQSGIGITGADYALAETGSLIILPRRGLSRLVSLVPPVHIALVRPEDLLDSLDDLFLLRRLEYHQRGGEMGSYLNFITGPSRTADIEMTIVEGVHGPKEVHMVILG
ncbi:MAG: lactate utilization protein [Chloroflexi bacterium]|nr:lactate utilization protein [Chloroflexota bacterium]MCI0896660.1 lactate utilization protein [Chloroflexota bacterium]MCI0900722.1 lactate utilization protein [Chloroflexota bacterium]